MSRFENDMFEIMIEVFERLYPDKKFRLMWDKLDSCLGLVSFDEEIPVIEIGINQNILQCLDILAHELAHVAEGYQEGEPDKHSDEWEAIYERLHQEYNDEIAKQEQESDE